MPPSFSIRIDRSDIDLIPVVFHKNGEVLYDFVLGPDHSVFDKYKNETFDAIVKPVLDFLFEKIASDVAVFMNRESFQKDEEDKIFQEDAMDIDVFYERWSQMLTQKIEELACVIEADK